MTAGASALRPRKTTSLKMKAGISSSEKEGAPKSLLLLSAAGPSRRHWGPPRAQLCAGPCAGHSASRSLRASLRERGPRRRPCRALLRQTRGVCRGCWPRQLTGAQPTGPLDGSPRESRPPGPHAGAIGSHRSAGREPGHRCGPRGQRPRQKNVQRRQGHPEVMTLTRGTACPSLPSLRDTAQPIGT
ncbi:hypothetical protein HJG60_011662 [Phyllostomus discolor]|uniref:Uncharacterized protein n=1 Tax=Phyllostomus discolor TaxID=89673 RepID=A0A833ZZF5_9CHIR|nr:hypothetical protein HJG60_011662 [Phyllostomus discolor]